MWYEKRLGPCPECEAPEYKINKYLVNAELNNALYKQAEQTQPKEEFKRLTKHYKNDIKEFVKERL